MGHRKFNIHDIAVDAERLLVELAAASSRQILINSRISDERTSIGLGAEDLTYLRHRPLLRRKRGDGVSCLQVMDEWRLIQRLVKLVLLYIGLRTGRAKVRVSSTEDAIA